MKRNETGQFQAKTDQGAETSTPATGTPVERARAALDGILDEAIKNDDADRIVEVLKLLGRFKDEAREARDSRLDPLVGQMTTGEKAELQEIVFRAAVIRATVALRLGVKPFMSESYSEVYQARILEAARERLGRTA